MKYIAPTGATDPSAPYVGRNIAAGIQGSRVPPEAVEHPQRELDALIAKSGRTPSSAVLTQVSDAVRSQRLNYVATVGGTANALTLTLDPAPAAWSDLTGTPLRLKVATTNTGAATLAVNALATVAIKRLDGSALQAGDLRAGQIAEVAYDGTNAQLLTPPAAAPAKVTYYETPGSYTFTVPPGVYSLDVEVWGAGGGGGGTGNSTLGGAGGGGAGGYSRKRVPTTPGQTYAITVGAGGAAGGQGGAGGAGGSSSFGSECSATGGGGGLQAGGPGNGGQGGVGTGGDINSMGGNGSAGAQASPGSGGPGGGAPFGGAGGGGAPGIPSGGTFPGGGGGARGSASLGAGGAGANGLVIVKYGA